MNLKQFRAQYPQYNDLSDQELTSGIHKKFYADIPYDDFLKRINPAAEDTGFFDMAGRALVRGAKQTGSLLGDVLPAMAGKAIGADEYAARQMAEAAETQKEIDAKYGARYKELSDVKGLGDVLPFVSETVLEQVPNLLTSIVPGAGGAVFGGKLAAQQAAKTLAGREATEAGARFAALKGAQGAAYGGAGGAFLGSYSLNAPEIFQNIEQETGQLELGASLLAGSVAAALDSVLPAYLVRQFTPGMKAGVVEKILEKSGMQQGLARGATAGAITGFATEAPTEAAQEAISIAAEKFVQENPDVWGSKEFNRLVESFVRGGVGGGGISSIAGGVKGALDKRTQERAQEAREQPAGRSALDQIDDAGEIEDFGSEFDAPATPFDEAAFTASLSQKGSTEGQNKSPASQPGNTTPNYNWGTNLDDLVYAQESRAQALRMAGMSEEEIQRRLESTGDPGARYKVTEYEKGLTVDQLRAAGVPRDTAKFIAKEIANNNLSGASKYYVNNILQGKVLFFDGWRVPTKEEYDNANETTRADFEAVKSFSDNAPQQELIMAQQMSFDLPQPEGEVSRDLPSPIEQGEAEFELTAPAGVAPPEVNIETDTTPVAAAPLNLAEKTTDRLEQMLNYLQPSVSSEVGQTNYQSQVKKFTDKLKEYTRDTDDPEVRKQNLADINEFFNLLGNTENKQLANSIVGDLKGKSQKQQSAIIAQRTRMPDITTPDGLMKLRDMFQDFMEQKNLARLGEPPSRAAINTFSSDTRVPKRVANTLRELRSRAEQLLTPEESAFMAYMSKFRYGLAMASAAYDIANDTPQRTLFSGQGAKTAKLFQKFVEENFPAGSSQAFDALVDLYRKDIDSATFAAQRIEARRKLRHAVSAQITGDLKNAAPSGWQSVADKPQTGLYKPLHPAIVERIRDSDLDGALELIEQMPGNKYWQQLARRMRALDLKTTTQIDAQQRFVDYYLQKAAPTTSKFIDQVMQVDPAIYDKYLAPAVGVANQITNVRAFSRGLNAILDQNLLGSTTPTTLSLLAQHYEHAANSLVAPAFYSASLDAINLNSDRFGNTYWAFFHELTHAATIHATKNPELLNKEQKQALDNLKELYEYAVKQHPDPTAHYGFTTLDEFIAEAFSNSAFQKVLARLPYKNTKASLWSKFIQYVQRLLGGTDNVLFGTLANADILMSAYTSTAPNRNKLTGTLFARATPVKRTTDGSFKVAPDMQLSRDWLKSVTNKPSWQKAKDGAARMLENVNDATRKHYLGAFTLRQLDDLIGGRLGSAAKNFISSIEKMMEDRNTTLDKVSKIEKRWSTFQAKNPEKGKALNLLMIDSTLAGIDPSVDPYKDAELERRWIALGPEGQAIYAAVRDFYKDRLNEYRSIFIKNIRLAMISQNKPQSEIDAAVAELTAEFNKDSISPYFPLKRFGRFWLQIGTGPKEAREFYMFDSAAARNKFQAQMQEQMAASKDARGMDAGNDLSNFFSKNIQDLQVLSQINKIVDGATAQDMGQLRDVIKDSVQQLYYLTLPNKSVRKMFINRKQVSGASEDMLRAFVDSSFHMAYQQSRFKYARTMFDQLAAAEAVRKDKPTELLKEKTVDKDYVSELERRLNYAMNPTDTGVIPSVLSNISFLWYLTAPASAIVNMFAVPVIGLPVLGARFGKGNAAKALKRYAASFFKSGFKDANGEWSMPTVDRSILSGVERRAFDIFVSRGLINITQSHDLAGVAEAPSNLYTGRMNTIMKAFSAMFHHAERFNREVVSMSAFRLAYDAAKKAGLSDNNAFNKAVEQAQDLTYRSMFDYSSLNKPRYLQGAYAKVILQFKQFPQQMTYLLARSGYEWIHNMSPDEIATLQDTIIRERAANNLPPLSEEDLKKAVAQQVDLIRKEGRDRLLGTLGMTFLVAGASGMPLFSVGSATIEALHAAFSDDDEPPLDFENWFKNWMAETFGNFWGDAVSRGLVTQALGVNIADRMSLNDLWFRDARKSQDEVTAFQNMIINLMGPTAALAISGVEAVKLFNDGMYYRAAEKALPAVFKQPLVAARYGSEGVLSLKGDELFEQSEINPKDILAQSLGFAPEKVSQRQKANIDTKAMEQDILNKRQDLLNAFFLGIDGNDDDLLDRVFDKIDTFNSMYPAVGITGETLMRSVRTRYKGRAMAEMTGGISLNTKLIPELEEFGQYGR